MEASHPKSSRSENVNVYTLFKTQDPERHTPSGRGEGAVHATESGCPLPVLTISLLFNFAASHFLEAKVLEVPSLMALL